MHGLRFERDHEHAWSRCPVRTRLHTRSNRQGESTRSPRRDLARTQKPPRQRVSCASRKARTLLDLTELECKLYGRFGRERSKIVNCVPLAAYRAARSAS